MGAKGGFLEEVSLGTGYFIQGRNGGRERILQSKLVAKMALTQEIDPFYSILPTSSLEINNAIKKGPDEID